MLPDSWIVTTNIDERNFEGLGLDKPTELDCVLITPIGIFVLDFKNQSGPVVPSQNGRWKVKGAYEDNPFDQMRDHIFALKRLLDRKLRSKRSPWITGLIIFTAEDIELKWKESDIGDQENRLKAIRIGEVRSSVMSLAFGRKLSLDIARNVLEVLKPARLVDSIFDLWHNGESRQSPQIKIQSALQDSTGSPSADADYDITRQVVPGAAGNPPRVIVRMTRREAQADRSPKPSAQGSQASSAHAAATDQFSEPPPNLVLLRPKH